MSSTKITPASTSGATASLAGGASFVSKSERVVRNRLPWLFATAVALSSIALAISGYLTYVALTSSKILGCGGGVFDCDHVLQSQWSTLLGLPVAAWASSLYLSVLVALGFTARAAVSVNDTLLRRWSWGIVTAAAVSAGLAALWFIGLQTFVLKHFCPWCLGAHTCGLVLCVSMLTFAPLTGRLKAMCAGLGAAGASGLIALQLLTPAPPTFVIEEFTPPPAPVIGAPADETELFDAPLDGDDVFMAPDAQARRQLPPAGFVWKELSQAAAMLRLLSSPSVALWGQVGLAGGQQADGQPADGQQAGEAKEEERTIHLSGANVKLRPSQWPIIGSPDAKYIFVELFDYTCNHCRATQRAIDGAKQQLGSDLAIIVLPVPLSRKCNSEVTTDHPSHRDSCELAQTAIALWKVDPSKFPEFHQWLMTASPMPSAASAQAKAAQLVDAQKLADQMGAAEKFIRSHVKIYGLMKAGPVPKLVFPATVLTGELTNANTLVDIIKRQP